MQSSQRDSDSRMIRTSVLSVTSVQWARGGSSGGAQAAMKRPCASKIARAASEREVLMRWGFPVVEEVTERGGGGGAILGTGPTMGHAG